MRHETPGSGEIDAFEHIGAAEQHFVPDRFRELPASGRDEVVKQIRGVGSEHRAGRFVGEILIEPLRQEPHEVRFGHLAGPAQNNFRRDVVTTKSFR